MSAEAAAGTAEAAEAHLDGGQQTIWAELGHALEATEKILKDSKLPARKKAVEQTKQLAVSTEGRLERWGGTAMQCVDVGPWLRVLMHSYHEEQVHRKCAVRLMFETALAGSITSEAPLYGPSGPPPLRPLAERAAAEAKPPTVDLPQLLAIVRTLWPGVSTAEACALYRDAHEATEGKVDHEAFLSVAERRQFFTSCLKLPPYLASHEGIKLPKKSRQKIGAMIHMQHRLLRPTLRRLAAKMPDAARARFEGASGDIETLLKYSTTQEDGVIEIDGMAPLAAYRRVLLLAAHQRMLNYELDMFNARAHAVVARRAREQRQARPGQLRAVHLPRAAQPRGGRDGLRRARQLRRDGDAPEALRRDQVLQRVAQAARGRDGPAAAAARADAPRLHVGPRRDPHAPRVHMRPELVQCVVNDVFAAALAARAHARARAAPPARASGKKGASVTGGGTLAPFVLDVLLKRWGVPSLVERALHDLFFNVRLLGPHLPRVALFGNLLGLNIQPHKPGAVADDGEGDGASGEGGANGEGRRRRERRRRRRRRGRRRRRRRRRAAAAQAASTDSLDDGADGAQGQEATDGATMTREREAALVFYYDALLFARARVRRAGRDRPLPDDARRARGHREGDALLARQARAARARRARALRPGLRAAQHQVRDDRRLDQRPQAAQDGGGGRPRRRRRVPEPHGAGVPRDVRRPAADRAHHVRRERGPRRRQRARVARRVQGAVEEDRAARGCAAAEHARGGGSCARARASLGI